MKCFLESVALSVVATVLFSSDVFSQTSTQVMPAGIYIVDNVSPNGMKFFGNKLVINQDGTAAYTIFNPYMGMCADASVTQIVTAGKLNLKMERRSDCPKSNWEVSKTSDGEWKVEGISIDGNKNGATATIKNKN